jgi:hypothetical protein
MLCSKVYYLVCLQYHILEKIDGITSETMLLLWSMKERHNCSSKFKIYFDTLPEEFKTGIPLWSATLCQWYFVNLEATNLK